MDVIKFKEEHYPVLKEWWSQYGWEAPQLETLPKTGFIALSEGKPVVAGFLYKTDSSMAFMDWIIGDKNASALSRGKGAHLVVSSIIQDARESGFQVLYTVTANQPLIESYKRQGLQEMEPGATTLAMSLTDKQLNFLR